MERAATEFCDGGIVDIRFIFNVFTSRCSEYEAFLTHAKCLISRVQFLLSRAPVCIIVYGGGATWNYHRRYTLLLERLVVQNQALTSLLCLFHHNL